jgi:undecaprenyl-diphosphatase
MVNASTAALRNGLDRLHRIDARLLVHVCRTRSPRLTGLMRALTRAGDPASWLMHALVVTAITGASDGQLPALLIVGVAMGTAVSQLLKRCCRRTRPDEHIPHFVALLRNPDAFSFPSGHTAVGFAVATALAGADPRLAVVEGIFAVAIGCSRVYLGAHYPLDVLAGAVLGVFAGLGATLLVASATI